MVLDSQTPDNVIITVNDPSNTDVTADPSSLTFITINWDSAQTVTVTASHDNDQNNEDATVTHTAASTDAMYDGITVSDVSVGVTDDDEVLETVSFRAASHSVIEGESTTIKVILSADPQTSASIPLTATSGTGLTSGDYSGVPASVDFVSGNTEKSFTLTAVQYQDDESDETLTLGFGTLPDGVLNGDTTQADVTIVDSIHVSFGASSYEAYEGGAGAQVIVKLDSPAPLEIVIPITSTAMNGATVEFADSGSDDWGRPGLGLGFTLRRSPTHASPA